MTHPVEMPEEFTQLLSDINDPAVAKVAANLGVDVSDYFLDYGLTDPRAQKRLSAYLDYILTHKDNQDKAGPLWRELDKVAEFGGVSRELKFFAKMRDAIRKRLNAKEPTGKSGKTRRR